MSSADLIALDLEPHEAVTRLLPRNDVGRRLVEVTAEMIDAEGEAAVRVQDVVAAAGVAVPALYREFGSREGLVQAAHVHRLRRALTAQLAWATEVFEPVEDAEQFREVLDRVVLDAWSPERQLARWQRANIVGSTYGRPDLTAAVAAVQAESIRLVADVLRRPQQRGWIRAELDLEGFAAWFAGLSIGRMVTELTPGLDDTTWKEISLAAVHRALFG